MIPVSMTTVNRGRGGFRENFSAMNPAPGAAREVPCKDPISLGLNRQAQALSMRSRASESTARLVAKDSRA